MAIYDGIKEIEEELLKCMKCGNCQAVCPIYKETKAEASVARGKIRLAEAVLKGEIGYTPGIAKRFDLCLTCEACAANCPCGVKPHKIVLAARAELARQKGLPTAKKAAFTLLRHPKLFDLGLRMGGTFQGLVFSKKDKGMSPRFPIGIESRRVLPPLAAQPLKSLVEESNKVKNPRMKVAFFSGCVTNYIYTSVGQAVIDVLNREGVEVFFPKGQHCCGAPAVINGDVETGREMAKSHVDLFSKEKVDAIVTVCGTCGESFKHRYAELLEKEGAYHEKAKALGAKTYDISQFLVDVLKVDFSKLANVPMKVTYHEPCHLGRGMGVTKQPMQILTSIPGLNYQAMKAPNRCCGGAGSFSLTNYPVSYQILGKKLDDISGTGANTVITACGSCRMQLEDGLTQEKMGQNVMHIIELVQKAYQK
ncbi:(Fe-S)-binding protein [Desulforamulus aquiferis]|uniref:Glycolate oxidase iron-sulfur subunit n=1 Tax=Desulforamulus aquiferis TaxID=1397668 RepID=A0AAW7ZGP6_9FIRM|nr:(Fe-S)-binding protein [Desulforamulus aquiferis]MDO7788568.1 (Fe-S)-binding protein [Desulforamulus aquiferis]